MLVGNVCSNIFLPEKANYSFYMNSDSGKLVNKVNNHFLQLFLSFVKGGNFTSAQYKPTVSCETLVSQNLVSWKELVQNTTIFS